MALLLRISSPDEASIQNNAIKEDQHKYLFIIPLTQESSQGKQRFNETSCAGPGQLPRLYSWATPHSAVETVVNLFFCVEGENILSCIKQPNSYLGQGMDGVEMYPVLLVGRAHAVNRHVTVERIGSSKIHHKAVLVLLVIRRKA